MNDLFRVNTLIRRRKVLVWIQDPEDDDEDEEEDNEEDEDDEEGQ